MSSCALTVLILLPLVLLACDRKSSAGDAPAARAPATRKHVGEVPKPAIDVTPPAAGETRTAVLGGGCFWCIETCYEYVDGVKDVVSGYAGGTADTATYERYADSNHAEVVQITYDPAKISFGELLRILFTVIDSTTKDGQHPDYGHQYRSVIFYANDEEKRVAEGYIKQLNDAKIFDKPIATTVEPLEKFYPAEDYHQDFARRNPKHPYIQRWSAPKLTKLRDRFAPELKSSTRPTTDQSQR